MTRALATSLVLMALAASGADWLGTSPEQHNEKILNTSNAARLQLIWSYKLDAAPHVSPLILGHWITNRGTKELLFIAAGREVYAIDGDLGTLFWKRALSANVECLAMAPVAEDEDDDDKPQALRPLFARLTGGRTVALHPTHGGEVKAGHSPGCRKTGFQSVRANGVVYLVAGKYFNGNPIAARVTTGLAIANGHVCFGTADNTVSCFGFPIDQ